MNTYAVSDLHGRYDLYEQICAFLKPDDKIYFLGDAIDRGPDSWKLFNAIFNNPQWVFMMGNHELMFADAIKEYYKYDGYHNEKRHLMYYNGGEGTWNGWMNDGAWAEWETEIRKLPTLLYYKNKEGKHIALSHAGFTANLDWRMTPLPYELVWSRDHFFEPWDENLSDYYCVHGHTPLGYLAEDLNIDITNSWEIQPIWYCDSHKVDIDSAAFKSGVTILLDLDTFEHYVFSDGKYFTTKDGKFVND